MSLYEVPRNAATLMEELEKRYGSALYDHRGQPTRGWRAELQVARARLDQAEREETAARLAAKTGLLARLSLAVRTFLRRSLANT